MYSWNMLGLDTLEMISVDYGKGEAFENLPFELRPGPTIDPTDFGKRPFKMLFLYPEHLDLLYRRFKQANPKGIVFIASDDDFTPFAPPGLTKKELDKLEEERKIFVNIFSTDASLGCPHVRKYLPELFEPGTIEEMAADPWLDSHLLATALEKGIVPRNPGESSRWSSEWRAYCNDLKASGQ
jgi:hypothetical protein